MLRTLLAIGAGAVLGAWARHGLALALSRPGQTLPLGTLVANVVGGLVIGAALGFLEGRSLAPEWRLFVVTGFLGALTAFSTYSAESFALLQRGQAGAALLHAAAHLLGSLVATWIGWRLMR